MITGNKIGTKINAFIDGKMYSKDFATEENAVAVFEAILAKDKDEVLSRFSASYRMSTLDGFEFEPETGETYMEGFSTPVPELILSTLEEYIESGFPTESISNFWRNLMRNPDKRIRKDLFKFLSVHDFSFTDKGYIVVYKTVDYKDKVDSGIAQFVSNNWLNVKNVWKESPSKYTVYKDEDGELAKSKSTTVSKWVLEGKNITVLGQLNDLYETITELEGESSTYTDKHTRTMHIELGIPVGFTRSEVDADFSRECSYGLHVGSTKYVEAFRGNGESPVLVCLIDPANVVAIPDYDNSKIRVCEYYPFAEGTVDENGKIEIIDSPYFEHDYMAFDETAMQDELQAIIAGEDPRESAIDAPSDERSLEEYRKIIEKRLVSLV